MLTSNLSTRPFQNERAVSLALLGVAAVVVLLTIFNTTRLVQLSGERRELNGRIAADRAAAAEVQRRTAAAQQAIGRSTMSTLSAATREANDLIDQRTFSWTAFFNEIEQTLPIDARLVSVSPSVDRGVFHVSMTVIARDLGDLDDFLDALRHTGAFRDVAPVESQAKDDGTFASTIAAVYVPAGRATAPAAASAGASAVAPVAAPPAAPPAAPARAPR